MLRHFRQKEIYWYCSHCYLEISDTLIMKNYHLFTKKQELKLKA